MTQPSEPTRNQHPIAPHTGAHHWPATGLPIAELDGGLYWIDLHGGRFLPVTPIPPPIAMTSDEGRRMIARLAVHACGRCRYPRLIVRGLDDHRHRCPNCGRLQWLSPAAPSVR